MGVAQPLSVHCGASYRSSPTKLVSLLQSPGLNLLPAPTLDPIKDADRKSKQLTTKERTVDWWLNPVSRALKNVCQSNSGGKGNFPSTSRVLLLTAITTSFTVERYGGNLAMTSKESPFHFRVGW